MGFLRTGREERREEERREEERREVHRAACRVLTKEKHAMPHQSRHFTEDTIAPTHTHTHTHTPTDSTGTAAAQGGRQEGR